MSTQLDRIEEKVDRIDRILTGGDEPEKGMVVQVDRLKQRDRGRTWWFRSLVVALLGAISAALAERFSFKH